MTTTELARAIQRRYDTFFTTRPPISFAIADDTASGEGKGEATVFGSGEPAFTLRIADARGAKALGTLDQFGVAVSYLNGWLGVDGDLAAALEMRRFFHDVHPVAWVSQFVPSLLIGRKASDKKAISAHYDEDSDFFLSFLDERHRCYTEGVFASDDEPIEDAMTRKMDLAIEALRVKPGDRVLEVGGGWGAFAEYAAKQGIDVTTLTLARESETYLSALFEREKLPNARVVREHIFSYTSPEPYDAIVNMGVTEHLPDYRTTIRKYAQLLKPGGHVYLDALAMRRKHRLSTFMSQYVYPGGQSPLLLHEYLYEVARSPFELISLVDDRHNYMLTCKRWAEKLDAKREEIVSRWGEPLYRRFRLFLWGSAAAFDTGLVQAYRWVLHKPQATA